MDTRQLHAFCEVVERKSFSQAAERLGVTQPAVSLQVRALEKRLGTQLLMREGAGVGQMLEEELRRVGTRLRDLGVRIELGLQESVANAVRAGHGVTFISRSSVEADLAAGTLVEARVAGLELEREIHLVRAAGRTETRAARAFVEFARETLQ